MTSDTPIIIKDLTEDQIDILADLALALVLANHKARLSEPTQTATDKEKEPSSSE